MLPTVKASASPFCVDVQGMAPECYYLDADQCRRRAQEISGRCIVNMEEIELPTGYGNYCMVAPGGIIECMYPDYSGCDREARHNKGVCVYNPSAQTVPEPFKSDVDSIY